MEGRIQNRSVLKRFGDWLDLEGVKRFPAVLDTSDIKAVIDLSSEYIPPAQYFSIDFFEASFNSGAANQLSVAVVGVQYVGVQVQYGANSKFAYNLTGFSYKVLAMSFLVTCTAGAAIANAGKICEVKVYLFPPDGTSPIIYPIWMEIFRITTGQLIYNFAWPEGGRIQADLRVSNGPGWDGNIPTGYGCALEFKKQDVTNFSGFAMSEGRILIEGRPNTLANPTFGYVD